VGVGVGVGVRELCVRERGGRRRTQTGVLNQTQDPYTKMWEIKTSFSEQNKHWTNMCPFVVSIRQIISGVGNHSPQNV